MYKRRRHIPLLKERGFFYFAPAERILLELSHINGKALTLFRIALYQHHCVRAHSLALTDGANAFARLGLDAD